MGASSNSFTPSKARVWTNERGLKAATTEMARDRLPDKTQTQEVL